MNSKHMMTMACAVALCGSVSSFAEAAEDRLDNDETSIVSAGVSLAFDSKFLSYGLVDNNDPILTPAAALNFFDWVTLSVESIFDISHYGKDAGYGDRAWRYQEIDPGMALSHYLPDIHMIDEEGEFGELEHAGLMDTCIKGDFNWTITDGVSLGAYVAYVDYLFDSSTREAARHYEATGSWDKSWNFVTGVSVAVAF